jgi:hypothetical protein
MWVYEARFLKWRWGAEIGTFFFMRNEWSIAIHLQYDDQLCLGRMFFVMVTILQTQILLQIIRIK